MSLPFFERFRHSKSEFCHSRRLRSPQGQIFRSPQQGYHRPRKEWTQLSAKPCKRKDTDVENGHGETGLNLS
jgi:hypothetical protein